LHFHDGGSSKILILKYFLIFINVLFDPETTENPSPPVLKKNIQSILSTGRYRTNQDSVQKQVRKHIFKGIVDITSSNPPFNEWHVRFITIPFKRLPWICKLGIFTFQWSHVYRKTRCERKKKISSFFILDQPLVYEYR